MPHKDKANRTAYYKEYRTKNKARINKYHKEYSAAHRSKTIQYNKQYRAANRDKLAEKELMNKYGINQAKYDTILESQGGVCAICEKPPKDNKKLGVDHSHQTKQIRGLLCDKCNTAIGKLQDNPELLRKAANYLEVNWNITEIVVARGSRVKARLNREKT